MDTDKVEVEFIVTTEVWNRLEAERIRRGHADLDEIVNELCMKLPPVPEP